MKTAGRALHGVSSLADNVANLGVNGKNAISNILSERKKGYSLKDQIHLQGLYIDEKLSASKGGKLYDTGKEILKATKNKAGSVVDKAKDNKVVKKVTDTVKGFFDKLLNSKAVKKKIKDGLADAGQEVTEEAVSKGISKLSKKIMGDFNEKIIKKITKSAFGKLVKNLASKANLIALAAVIIKDFIWGFDQAKAILGIDNVSFPQKILSGLVNVVNNFLFAGIIDTNVIVDWLAGPVLTIFGQDAEMFKQQQKEADAIVDKYNIERGTNYSKEEYYKNQTFTGKIDNKISDTWQGAKKLGNKALKAGKDLLSKINPFKKKKLNNLKLHRLIMVLVMSLKR